ncbi:unnamed protein product [Phytophthora lilii]|uniref:Unnamed protein product n=1 Tax=Phytophthora lilii TaxID=2077276 RepID=A0A9W6TLM7_9STRA|nr:unnamed protein product [Phytophthora lilii]
MNDWETSKYHPKLSESQIKSIAGGTDRASYNKWKEEYEPKEIKEKKERTKKDDDFTVPYYPKFCIYYEKGELPPIFHCKNTETYLGVISMKIEVITMERLYKFIKNNIAYILQVIPPIKQLDIMFDINNAIELDDDGPIETGNTEFDTDSIITVQLSDVIYHYRDDTTFGKVDFMPYDAKTGAYNSQLNTFDWNSNELKLFKDHIKHIWCDGRDDLTNQIMKLFAWYVQRPYEKSGACVVLEGEEGCGKNIAFKILKKHVIETRYCLETPKMKILTERFNSARENKIYFTLVERKVLASIQRRRGPNVAGTFGLLTVLNEAANVKQSSHEDQRRTQRLYYRADLYD